MRIAILFVSMLCFFVCDNHPERAAASSLAATINGEQITNEDLEFNQLLNRMQIQMNREADQKRLQGGELKASMQYWDQQEQDAGDRNTLLTQIIRLRAAALLAKEKGYTATDTEVKKEIETARQMYGSLPEALEMMKGYGETRFWKKELLQTQFIVLAKKVQRDVLNKVKQEHPKAVGKEINFLAGKAYEELLISQIDSCKITLVK